MPEEKRLIVELRGCDQERIAAQAALSNPQESVLIDGFRQLAKAAELARGRVDAVQVRLRSLRTAKRRKKDSDTLHKLQNALNGLAEEIDTITYAGEVYKEQAQGPEVIAAHHERYQRLETIREKLAELTLVMECVDGKPRSPSPTDLYALQKLQSAESNLDAVETHLNNAEGAHAVDQDEIASAKSSAYDVEDDLKAAKVALEKSAP
jgi:hypothetical protein